MIQKGDKKIIRGWVMYDWANSVYNLVISSAIFPIFYEFKTREVYAEKMKLDIEKVDRTAVTVDFFGISVSSSIIYSLVLSFSFLIVAFMSPLLSGIADYTGTKKKFLKFFCYLGSFAAATLFFFDSRHIELGMLSVFFASVGFWNSLVFYNAFLPEIAEPKDQDKVSARGFIMGYLGSMILLIICLLLMKAPIIHFFDDPNTVKFEGLPAAYCFVLVGFWWVGFSQLTYRVLPNNVYNKKPEPGYLWRGFKQLKLVFQEFKKTKRLKRFLQSFFFFNTGVQTVMLMATVFASKAINWPGDSGETGLIIAILLIQILGALGAKLMSIIAIKLDNVKALMVSVGLWISICFWAFFITKPIEFYLLASCVGLVMGGVQAVARSTYSKYLPETTDHASYFSFYDATEKIGIVFGTAFFALAEYLFDNIRYSIFSVAFFFIVGFILLFFVPKKEIELETTH
jgi:UMF1 family MFS transporter